MNLGRKGEWRKKPGIKKKREGGEVYHFLGQKRKKNLEQRGMRERRKKPKKRQKKKQRKEREREQVRERDEGKRKSENRRYYYYFLI